MAQANVEAWQKNLAAKILEAELEIYRFMIREVPDPTGIQESTKSSVVTQRERFRNTTFEAVNREIANISGLYDLANRPPEIEQLKDAVEALNKKRSNPQAAVDVLAALERLKRVPSTGSKFVSFHDIYEQFSKDGELNQLVDELIQTLEKIIEEDDGSLSSRVEKDLINLLKQIKNRPKLSTYEIGAWADLTGRFLLELAGQKHGVPGLSVLVDAAKLAKRVFDNVFDKYQQSQSEYVRLIGLKTAPESFSSLPPLSDEVIRAVELSASKSEVHKLPSSPKTSDPPASEPVELASP